MVSMASHRAILENGVYLQIYSYLTSILSLNTIHGTKLNLRHISFIQWSDKQNLICVLMNINIKIEMRVKNAKQIKWSYMYLQDYLYPSCLLSHATKRSSKINNVF